jgi:hypothetical protein
MLYNNVKMKSYQKNPSSIDFQIELPNGEIIHLDNCHIIDDISTNGTDFISLHGNVEGSTVKQGIMHILPVENPSELPLYYVDLFVKDN